MPLEPEKGYLIDFKSIPRDLAKRAKILFINYPNNPTGAVAGEAFYREVIEFARGTKFLYVMTLLIPTYPLMVISHPVFCSFRGKEVGIEFHSVSKTYNMTGWRVGWAAGNAEAVEALGRLKSNIDSGVFRQSSMLPLPD